jgi:hypothetical protein
MARRRQPPAESLERTGTVPENLLRCVVEDWVAPAEFVELRRGESVADVAASVKLVAWRRQRAARRRWLDEHGVARADEHDVVPMSVPRFHDWPSFARAAGLARLQ